MQRKAKPVAKRARRSGLEKTLAWQIEAEDLPVPQTELTFKDGRKWRFDFAWPELWIAVEVEGGTYSAGRHVRPRGFEADCEKYNAAALLGWSVYRVTGAMIRDGRALAVIEEAIAEAVRVMDDEEA